QRSRRRPCATSLMPGGTPGSKQTGGLAAGTRTRRSSTASASSDLSGSWPRREMDESGPYLIRAIGVVHSTLRDRGDATTQASEGAPEAVLEIDPAFADALHRVEPGDELIVLTWLHLADRGVLQVHPRDDESIPLTGVFRTRSSDRPNPIGVHRVA